MAWHTLAEAKPLAAAEKKPLMVDFYVPSGCNRCETMDRRLWSVAEIAREVNDGFVPVRVDLSKPLTDEEKELGRRYDFNFDCLLLFLDPEGKVLEKAGGGRMCFAEFVDQVVPGAPGPGAEGGGDPLGPGLPRPLKQGDPHEP